MAKRSVGAQYSCAAKSAAAKLHDTLILLACLMSVWLIWITHLLHFSLRY